MIVDEFIEILDNGIYFDINKLSVIHKHNVFYKIV